MRALRSLASFAAASLAAMALFAPSPARANGRFPIADQLVVDPKDPTHLVLRTTYGILGSNDSGKSWSWVCEAAVGYGGTQDPAMGVLGDGTVLAGVFEGLAVTHDRGCSWAMAGGPLAQQYTIDVSVHHDDPSRGVAITSTGIGNGNFHVALAETADNGASWTLAGNALDTDFLALTVDVAPSDPNRVYLSGLVGKSLQPAMQRTDDRGKTWTITYLDAAYAKGTPFIAAIDPQNPDRVYLRLSMSPASAGDPDDRMLVSDDGAVTFKEVYAGKDDLLGFALSPDGTRVALGGPKDGIQMAAAKDLAFQQVSKLYTRCLVWTPGGLYACANEFTDGFTLGLSKDDGKTFASVYHLSDLAQMECPAGSPTPPACAPTWPAVCSTLGVKPPACGDAPTTSSSSNSGGASPAPSTGCNCHIEPSAPALAGPLAALAIALGALLRRGRRDRA
jgi:MYXO-CTERM domain-containing protein